MVLFALLFKPSSSISFNPSHWVVVKGILSSLNAQLTDHLANSQYILLAVPEKRKLKTPNSITVDFLKQNSSEKHCK